MSATNSIRSKVEGDLNVSTTSHFLTDPQIINTALPNDSSEVTLTLPLNTFAYEMKTESGSTFQLRFVSTGPYLTVTSDCVTGLNPSVSLTLYITGSRAGGDMLQTRVWK